MILFTNIASFVIDNVKNCLHVSGEITDTNTLKAFYFRGKATIIPRNENDVSFHTLQQIEQQSVDPREIVVVNVESTEEIASSHSGKNKMTYHNLWKF
jgi:hypothetical protein